MSRNTAAPSSAALLKGSRGTGFPRLASRSVSISPACGGDCVNDALGANGPGELKMPAAGVARSVRKR
jgi:hypothetical protein